MMFLCRSCSYIGCSYRGRALYLYGCDSYLYGVEISDINCILCAETSNVVCRLRVNLDIAKITYSLFIQRDAEIAGTIVRCTTIPEELGRIRYLLTDKTGTLTQNEMVFRKLHMGT